VKERIHTLLITGAIDISKFFVPFVKITDLQERLQQYLDSLEYAINHYSEVNHIVFCENTNYQHDFSDLQKKAEQNGKTLEILTFSGDYEKIQQKGKGYGEGEIIKYALENSKILAQSDCFYKLTGRLMVENMGKIIRSTKSENAFVFSSLFEKKERCFYAKTAFYKVSTEFYKQNLLNAYLEVDDTQHRYLEHVFYEKLLKFPIKSFIAYPNLAGISGTSGTSYQISKKEFLKNKIFAKLGFFDNYETFKQHIIVPIFLFVRMIHLMLKPKIIVRVDGGISSQMQQYLLGRIFFEKGYRVEYDLRWFKKHGKDMNGVLERNFDLQKAFFQLDFVVANSPECKLYSRFFSTKSNYFDHENEDVFLFDLIPPKYLGGYYRTPNIIYTDFFSRYFYVNFEVLDEKNKAFYNEIKQQKKSVAIHVRRGDLKDFSIAYGHPANAKYFQKAISYFNEKIEQPYFYFFSDETEWIKNELQKTLSINESQYKIVDINGSEKGFLDLFLMASCSHQITSKGSFGKFAALLNHNPEKIVVLCDDPLEYVWKERLQNTVFL
jgi:hypothetical protein